MKTRILLQLVLVLLFSVITYSQSVEYNLKNISQLKVMVNDTQNIFSSTLYQKILTETKLKLMSAGLKIAKEEDDAPILEIKPNYIQSVLSEHRILIQLRLIESVITSRKDNIRTEALTYLDMEFYASKDIPNSVYNKLMDSMLIRFIELYLSQKGN